MNNDSHLITPHPSPSLAEPPTTAPLLQPLNTSWLDDSDIPSFLVTSAGSKRRHDFDVDAPLPAASESATTSNKFFLATPLEMTRDERSSTATHSSANVVTPPSSPRFRLRMRPSTCSDIIGVDDDILTGETTTPPTPAPVVTNSTPVTNLPVTSERINFNMMTTDLSVVSMKLSDHAATAQEEQRKSAPSATVPKIGVPSKKRKTMRRNSSFNALCA